MSENDTSQEIIKNDSSSLMVTTITPKATPAATATNITDEYKKVKMDHFNLNLHNTNIQNCHSSQFSHDCDFHLIKYNIPLRPKINQIQYRITNEIIKLQNIFNELKTQDEELIKKLDISIKENNIQY